VQLTTPEQIEAMRMNRVDLGFQQNQGEASDLLTVLPLWQDKFVLAVAEDHPFVNRKKIQISDLATQPLIWLHRSVNPLLSDRVRGLLTQKGPMPRIILEAKSDASMMNFVASGLGLGIVVSTPRKGNLGVVFKPVQDLNLPVAFTLAWRRDDKSIPLLNFVKLVKELVSKTFRQGGRNGKIKS